MNKIIIIIIIITSISHTLALEVGRIYITPKLGYEVNRYTLDKELSKFTSQRELLFKGFNGEVNFGYSVSQNIATDLTITSLNASKYIYYTVNELAFRLMKSLTANEKIIATPKKGTKFNCKSHMREDNYALMMNFYYHFRYCKILTPYFMTGVGINKGRLHVTEYVRYIGISKRIITFETLPLKSKEILNFLYQLGAGVKYKILPNTFLDIGYKFYKRNKDRYNSQESRNIYNKIIYKSGSWLGYPSESIHTGLIGIVLIL